MPWVQVEAQVSLSFSPHVNASYCRGIRALSVLYRTTCTVQNETSLKWTVVTPRTSHTVVMPSGRRITTLIDHAGGGFAGVQLVSSGDPLETRLNLVPYHHVLPVTLTCQSVSSPSVMFSRTIKLKGNQKIYKFRFSLLQ